MNKAEDYKHIAAWGNFMRSYKYYIDDQQRIAAKDQAPLNAIFKRSDGTWCTADEIKNSTLKIDINKAAEEL
jgi:hypothetical protein